MAIGLQFFSSDRKILGGSTLAAMTRHASDVVALPVSIRRGGVFELCKLNCTSFCVFMKFSPRIMLAHS